VPSIDDACSALAAVVNQIPELRAKGYIDDVTNPPEAQVYTREFDPRMVFGDANRVFQLGVRVFVRRTDLRSAQQRLRSFMEPSGASSVRAKIEDGDSWAETIHYAEVTNIGQPFEYSPDSGTTVFWCADWDVDVVW
jgi:hypothetical protein